MRTLLALVVAATMTVAALAAPVFADPRGLVAYVYALYENDEYLADPAELFSPSLRAMWEDAYAADPMGLGFDPFIDGQDFEITDLVITDPVVSGDSATVAVSFRNFGEVTELRYELMHRAEGWKIDDIVSAGEWGWRLSELLAVDPMLN